MATAKHLVGRVAEIDAFDRLLADLDRGRPAAIELVGEPGIGKTRLLAELGARADARAALVLSGSASELEQDLPFGVFVDALDDYVRGLEPHRLESLDDDVRTELVAVFPSLTGLPGSGSPAVQHERYRSYRAVRKLLELLALGKAVVLVLDDVHWADPASAELLGALLRRPPAAPVLMALALRPRQVPERLSSALARAHRGGTLVRAELAALTRPEVAELLGDATAADGVDELYHESGGNPFYLEQLARSVRRSDQPSAGPGGTIWLGAEIPALVAAALSEELELLSESARLVLEGAAVAGDPFEPELAAAAAATPEGVAIDALDELLRFDLVRATDVPRRFRFRHPLLRRAVYESTRGGWRLGAHERCAGALAARGAPVVARAHHVERSAREGDAAAVAVLREAGEAAAQHAPATAARWFAGALRLASEGAPVEERLGLLLARARSLAATGLFAESRTALLEAVALVPGDSLAMRVRLTTACAGVEHLLGLHEHAHQRLVNTLDALDDVTSPEAAALMIELAVGGYYRMQCGSMREWAGRAVAVARPLADRALLSRALAVLAHGCALDGAMAEADVHCAEAASVIDALTDVELAACLDSAASLAAAEFNSEWLDRAVAHGERALAIGRATGQTDIVPVLTYSLGWTRRVRGELALSADLLDGAVESARVSGNTLSIAGNLLNRSLTALAAGDLELALSTAQESFDLARQLDQGIASASAALALAASLVEAGDPQRAVEVLVGPGGDELSHVPAAWRAGRLELLTRCWLALGRREEAEQSAARSRVSAGSFGRRLAGVSADRAEAAVALAASDPERAAELALSSAALADEVGARIEAGVSRTLAGQALAQVGRSEHAISELQRAAADLHECGAIRYRDAAERELRGLGRRVERRTRPGSANANGLASLSEREFQVARLIVDRNTNPEIAAALFLSPKTVETHVRNIFRKLGVSSRVQVARAVERDDAASDKSRA